MDSDGTNLYFLGQTNDGGQAVYLSAPLAWTTWLWHQIALTYSATNSSLYLDGVLVTNGPGVSYLPGPDAVAQGFFIGSDTNGTLQAHGMFDDLSTYDFQLSSNAVGWAFASHWIPFYGNPDDPANWISTFSGGFGPMDAGFRPPPGGFGGSGGQFDFGTNLWLWITSVSNDVATVALMNTIADVLYEIQSTTNLALVAQSGWISEGFVDGSELTNWTAATVNASAPGSLFLRIRSWQDTTGTEIPDWWWLLYFGQTTNVDASASAAGDGYSNFQKFQMGLNPTNYFNPNPPAGFFGSVDPTGTNAVLNWNPAPGPVMNYVIWRGILDTNTDAYNYAQAGVTSSNAIYFRDVGAISNSNALNNLYNLTAAYPGGSFSGTDTWQASWYSGYGASGPPYGPPLPNNVYAYADSTGTNVLISWTPAQGAPTNYVIERGISDPISGGIDYSVIAEVGTNTNSFKAVDAITNTSGWSDFFAVVAAYPGGGLSQPAASFINVGATNGPAAPAGFTGYVDSTGTNLYLNWQPGGTATNYLLFGGNYSGQLGGGYQFVPLGKVSGGTSSFEVRGGINGYGGNLYAVYGVVAVYADGSLSQAAQWFTTSGNDSPAPGALYAYVDSTGTNVAVTWTPAQGPVTSYIIQRSDDYGADYSQIGEVAGTTNSFVDVGEVNDPYYDTNAIWYEVEAAYPNGGLSAPVTTMISGVPPSPTGLSATVDSTGTNVFLSWTQAVGKITGYLILRGTYNPTNGVYTYSQIGSVGTGTHSFEDVGALANGNDNNNTIYQVVANYGGGFVSPPASSALDQFSWSSSTWNLSVSAQMVRNQNGRWQLMFPNIPASVQKIAFYWYLWDYFWDGAYPGSVAGLTFTTENDIPVSSITNGVYVLPDFLMTNWFPNNLIGKFAMVQPIGTNGQYGQLSSAGWQPYDSPVFVDGRQALKQNLLYELRQATISQPGMQLYENNVWNGAYFTEVFVPTDTNYVESSLFHDSQYLFKGYIQDQLEYMQMDNVWPFIANYELHLNLYDPHYTGPVTFPWETDLQSFNDVTDTWGPINYNFQGNLEAVAALPVLGVGDPYWILQSLGNLPDLGASSDGNNLYFSGGHNLYGLVFSNALVNAGDPGTGTPILTLNPGQSEALTNVNCFYSQTVDPIINLGDYYFAPVIVPQGTALVGGTTPVQTYPLPAHTGFASTNQTGVLIASVGVPVVIGGWARFSIENGGSSKFAYLGQYFVTNAYLLGTNGDPTTNTTGVISPYGDFFPTEPGAVAMMTLPDIDTGQQGTSVVRVISLNVDANHDGTMDFTYNGPDFVTTNNPFRFWANDAQDDGDFGGNGIPGQGAQGNGVLPIMHRWLIHGRRDLVNYFPVYLDIGSLFQETPLGPGISATDTNYQFVLSQADGVLRFAYTDLTPTNYMNFLLDTNESSKLAYQSGSSTYAVLTAITNVINGGVPLEQSFVGGIAASNQGIILVEAAAPTTRPLVLTIYHGTNQIAQTSLYLSISGVEQMFRFKNLLVGSATNNAEAQSDRLTDASVPNEPNTIDKNVVFVHGYNVNSYYARGWFADIYKRLYWSGSHAKFYGVNWYGCDSQIGTTTPNYQVNVVHAFQTAPLLANFVATLTNSGPVVMMAHSLGNMVALSAMSDYGAPMNQYFMLDAAVPIEAIDASATINTNMVTSTTATPWLNYNTALWASEWYNVWPTNDARSALSWKGRLDNFGDTELYNCYSSGEEVLRTSMGPPPSNLFSLVFAEIEQYLESNSGNFAWTWQEKCKGLMPSVLNNSILSSDHGGWGLNGNLNSGYVFFVNGLRTNIPPAGITNSVLQTNAFFDMSYDTALFTNGPSGSAYAQTNRNSILSAAIPALTLPIGANAVTNLDEPGATHNFDMQGVFENSWPPGRPAQLVGATAAGEWHHSDLRVVAYTFTYKLFNQIATLGNLQ